MQTIQVLRRGPRSLWREERGVIMAMVLVLMTLLMGVGATAIYSGYTNLQTATNLKLASQAKAQAETNVNEAIYRLSRQETDPSAIIPDLANPNWQMDIAFTSGDSNASDGAVSTIQASNDWPEQHPAHPVTIRFKRPDAAHTDRVLFINNSTTPPTFRQISLPGAIPADFYPVLQIVATALDERGAERQILAETAESTAFAPPAPLSSGVDVDLNGSGFLDGVNHDHRIYITPGAGGSAIYGDNATGGTDETTNSHSGSVSRDSPDDTKDDNKAPRACGNSGDHDVANKAVTGTALSSCPRLFNMQISQTDATPAWVGLQWISNPTLAGCSATHGTAAHWHGTNTDFASAVALSNGPQITRDQPPSGNVWTKGVFSWRLNNRAGLGADRGYPSSCSDGTSLWCRPAPLTPFPNLQQYLNMDDATFQSLLENADTTREDLDAGRPPLGFTYIQGDYIFNNSTASPGTNDFGLLYVTGNLTINGNQVFKGLVFVEGSFHVGGSPVILGAVMVRGATHITTGTGNMKLIYSKRAAELGVQAAHPWRILSWIDAAMEN